MNILGRGDSSTTTTGEPDVGGGEGIEEGVEGGGDDTGGDFDVDFDVADVCDTDGCNCIGCF